MIGATNINAGLKSCQYCTHDKVCGIYDAFLDANIKVNDYGTLNPGCDDRIYQTLAENCVAYRSTWEE